jgi:acyl-CoA synthetase (AMP-forming)/AMP-acid ligase II
MLTHHILENAADAAPDQQALWEQGAWRTYAETESAANRLAHALLGHGILPGARVAIMMDNSFAYVAAHFATLKAGGVNVCLNTELKPAMLEWMLADSGAEAIFIGARYLPLLLEAAGSHPRLKLVMAPGLTGGAPAGSPAGTAWLDFTAAVSAGPDARPAAPRIDLDLASIVYTSGSTGKPKGVMLSHLNLVSNTRSICADMGITAADRILSVLPFYYIYGQSLFYTHFAARGSVVIDNRFAYPNVVLDTMGNLEVTGFAGVPTTFMILLNQSTLKKRSFPALRYVSQAGGALAASIQREVAEAFPQARFFVMYGATEAAPRLTSGEPSRNGKWGSIGKAIPNVRVFVGDAEGRPLPLGETGEIIARGSNIMMGYWKDPDGTAEVLRDGNYFTGDLGRMDGDGHIFIEGRIKDIIKVGGNRVSAQEIEEAILGLGGVLETAVIGVEDPILGEAVKAFVVFKDGALAFEEMRSRLRDSLPPYKIPTRFEARPQLPKAASGKILKSALREAEKAPLTAKKSDS